MTHPTGPDTVPDDVLEAIAALGSRARSVIIHHISVHGVSSSDELASAIGSTSAHIHTKLLERTGIIVRSARPGGAPRASYWRIEQPRLAQLTKTWTDYLDGAEAPLSALSAEAQPKALPTTVSHP